MPGTNGLHLAAGSSSCASSVASLPPWLSALFPALYCAWLPRPTPLIKEEREGEQHSTLRTGAGCAARTSAVPRGCTPNSGCHSSMLCCAYFTTFHVQATPPPNPPHAWPDASTSEPESQVVRKDQSQRVCSVTPPPPAWPRVLLAPCVFPRAHRRLAGLVRMEDLVPRSLGIRTCHRTACPKAWGK